MSDILTSVLVWIVFWFGTWGIHLFLQKKGINGADNVIIESTVFFIPTLILIFLFRDIFIDITKDFILFPFIFILLVIILDYVIIYLAKHNDKTSKLIRNYKGFAFFRMSYKYPITKIFQILFQQSLIIILLFSLLESTLDVRLSVLIFFLVFVISHLPNFITIGGKLGVFFVVASIFGGLIFALLILEFNYGFVYSFAVHSLFYTFLGEMFWVVSKR